MRKLLFALYLCALLFSSYTDPPFNETQEHNNEILRNITERYLENAPKQQPTFENPIAFAGGELLFLFPSVDDRISADNQTTLIWVWAEEHENEVWEKSATDGCPDKITFSDFNLSGRISFTFKNITKNLSIDKNSLFTVFVPFSQEELDKTNGTDVLSTNLSGQFIFSYVHEIRKCVGLPICGCAPVDEEEVEFTKSFSNEFNYTVEGGSTLFFLAAPLLREQWFRNNHFDNIVLAKRLFYKGDIKKNDGEIASFYFYNFNISEDKYGFWHIKSFRNYSMVNMTAAEYNTTIMPRPLEKENETFIYVDVFNTTYEGLGTNNLSLTLHDHFGNVYEKKWLIASRVLSFNRNMSEDGLSHNETEMRESASFISNSIKLEPFSLTTLGMLFILFLAFNRLIRAQR